MEEIVWAGRTISELSRELGVAPEDLRRLIRLMERRPRPERGWFPRAASASSSSNSKSSGSCSAASPSPCASWRSRASCSRAQDPGPMSRSWPGAEVSGVGVSVHDPLLAREDENADPVFSRGYGRAGRIFIAGMKRGIIERGRQIMPNFMPDPERPVALRRLSSTPRHRSGQPPQTPDFRYSGGDDPLRHTMLAQAFE